MNENNNKGRGVFYGVIGVATLVVAIIGATFAYFTASAQNGANEITGNMANVSFDLVVKKIVDPGRTSGMIPMSNNMVDAAVRASTPCQDNNGNAVCQIYEITVTNNSTATMFVDGYVALAGGSGAATDVTAANITPTHNQTTMRWAQVFATGSGTEATYSTGGNVILSATASEAAGSTMSISNLNVPTDSTTNSTDETGFNPTNVIADGMIGTGAASIGGNPYDAVNRNYIRISDHTVTEGIVDPENFTRENDKTSMLIINQQLGPDDNVAGSGYDIVKYYFVVWLSETGTDQTARADAGSLIPTEPDNFFNGIVKFISAQGSEVTATFSGYTAVNSQPSQQSPTT
ncbi:MAG: hypothetical protein VZS44_01020 [Bacilli bacterium]|nr:hypothetical protein [Bacilli bacterium]